MSSRPNLFSDKSSVPILLISVFIIAVCGILYELLISSISAYFLGSSVLHFSLTIGLFLSFMGVGAYFSRFFEDDFLLDNFILIEIYLGIIGGASGVILYLAYSLTANYYLIAFLLIAFIGSLVGLEIPILTRIIRNYFELKETLAQVLSFDYLGALVASVIFPLVLLPQLGLTRTSFFIGLLNLSVGIFNLWIFRKYLHQFKIKFCIAFLTTFIYIIGFFYAFGINAYLEQFLYEDEVIFSTQSPYQRLVLTRWNQDIRLYINGNLQFSSMDEYRYHETLVHIPMALVCKPESVLLLGAGDGLAAREILKYPEVRELDLVDLDPVMTDLGKNNLIFKRLNENSLNNPKVRIFNEDAYKFVEESSKIYSLIIIDFPDPSDVAIGKLYTKEFYHLVKKHLAKDGVIVTQSSSPFFAREVFWCIKQTMASVFPSVIPYNAHIPSFGQWGFNVALNYSYAKNIDSLAKEIKEKLKAKKKQLFFRYLNPEVIPTLFYFDGDMTEIPTEINTLDTQQLVLYYEKSWEEFN